MFHGGLCADKSTIKNLIAWGLDISTDSIVKETMSLAITVPSVLRTSPCTRAESDVSLSLPTAHFGRALGCSTIPIATGNRSGRLRSIRCLSAPDPNLKATLDKVVTSQKIVLFMKGTKDFPQCGFSNTVVQILRSLNAPFETINILENEALRQGLKEYSSWPTFPQLYIDGEFFGGCDITVEAYKSGELQELLERTICS